MTLPLHNGELLDRAKIPQQNVAEFRRQVIAHVGEGARVAALFGLPGNGSVPVLAALANGMSGTLALVGMEISGEYPSLTPDVPQVHWFEREIAEQCGVIPQGHPWLKPVRFVQSQRPGHDAWGRPPANRRSSARPISTASKARRFTRWRSGRCMPESSSRVIFASSVMARMCCTWRFPSATSIAASSGRWWAGRTNARSITWKRWRATRQSGTRRRTARQSKRWLAAACRRRARALRGVALELERLANHTGDLGALAGDVGYLPTQSFCGRLRGDFLNMTALVCGSRFGRGLVRPGGVGFDVDGTRIGQLRERLEQALRDVTSAANLLWDTSSVRGRFEKTGALTTETARETGLVGVAARACGLERDVRHEFPSGIYQFVQIPVSTYHTGDVFARAYVRWLEIQRSVAFVREQLDALPAGPVRAKVGPLANDAAVVALVEGWRGEICHVALTDTTGRFARYKVVDPSFHNWFGLALALRNQQISDFPLCNKSFNLSYCGHDL